jgi:hypothetical protein
MSEKTKHTEACTTDTDVMSTLLREMGLIGACRYAMRKRDVNPQSELGQQYGRVLQLLHASRSSFAPNPPLVSTGRNG